MSKLQSLKEWQQLNKHAQGIHSLHTRDLLSVERNRQETMWAQSHSLTLDYSKQLITTPIIKLLLELAEKRDLPSKIENLFSGKCVNVSENRPALHMALRSSSSRSLPYPKHIIKQIDDAWHKTKHIAAQIRDQKWTGATGEVITDIVNIGIGGSDLGPKMTINALKEFTSKNINYHFISDGDPLSFDDVVEDLNPKTTLFIVASKSFTTQETLLNFQKAKNWVNHSLAIASQFIAVTSKPQKAQQLNFKHILPVWDWVGGRYSTFSAVNLITLVAVGEKNFDDFLKGAASMDEHFYHTPFALNLPVLMAVMGIWSINFLNKNSLAVLCYSRRLKHFVPYIQQLDMESNAKRVTLDNQIVEYPTGPIVWGGLGNQAQHAYYQLLCQGTQRVPCDFIMLDDNNSLNHFALNKIHALSQGTLHTDQLNEELPGNTPLNIIRLKSLNPHSLGELIALYEHKIFCQSVIWDINPFDQPGVDSTKKHYLSAADKQLTLTSS